MSLSYKDCVGYEISINNNKAEWIELTKRKEEVIKDWYFLSEDTIKELLAEGYPKNAIYPDDEDMKVVELMMKYAKTKPIEVPLLNGAIFRYRFAIDDGAFDDEYGMQFEIKKGDAIYSGWITDDIIETKLLDIEKDSSYAIKIVKEALNEWNRKDSSAKFPNDDWNKQFYSNIKESLNLISA